MANGYCPALLRSIESIAGENAPSRKLHVAGFLAMTFCCQNSSVSPVNDGYTADGQQRGLTVSYRKRPVLADVQDEDDCDINKLPAKSEWNLPALSHKQYSFYMSDDQVSRYCAEYATSVALGLPATQVMREHYDNIIEGANILLSAINRDLVTLASTQFGTNIVSGSNAARTINIPQTPNMTLNTGVIQLLRDFQENEICGDPCLVGGGLFAGYNIAQQIACCNEAGLDFSRLGLPRFFFDKDSQAIWGANQIGAFSPGSVKFINRQRYVGPYAGEKGNSFFFTLPLPVSEFGCAQDCLSDLVFDVQMRYIDCPTSVTINGSAVTVNRGWQFIISKTYALWVQPTDAYAAGDPLANTNGTLRYVITNT